MKAIASRDNPKYKELKRLARHASARRTTHGAILEGIHLCEAFLQSSGVPVVCALSRSAEHNAEVAEIVTALTKRLAARDILLIDDALFASLSQVERGVGILFAIDVPRQAAPERIDHSCVLLDRIQDPGNLGSILRSAAAAGMQHVYASRLSVDAWSPKVLRAGMGAHFALQVVEDCDLDALLSRVSIPLVATDSHAHETIFDADLGAEIAWLFGNEGQGVAPALAARARALRIPQPGGLESLNVAAAAAICFFEQVRQRAQRTGGA